MTTIEVSTHSGDVDELEVDDYNPSELLTKLNDNEINSVKLGNNIYSKIDIKNIRVIEDTK